MGRLQSVGGLPVNARRFIGDPRARVGGRYRRPLLRRLAQTHRLTLDHQSEIGGVQTQIFKS